MGKAFLFERKIIMKKIVSILLALLLISTCTISAFATSVDTNITNALSYYKTTFAADYALPATDAKHKNADVWTLYCLASLSDITNTDYAFMVPTVDPTKAAGYNNPADVAKDILADTLLHSTAIDATIVANLDSRQAADGNFKDKTAKITAMDDIWSIIALEVAKANGATVNYDKAKAVSALLALQKADGGFNDWDTKGSVDTTGMALIALTIAGADCTSTISYMAGTLDVNGNFVGKDAYGSVNCCSQAYAIIGLIAAGEDVTSAKWTKNGKTILDVLLAYQDANGGFWYDAAAKNGTSPWYTAPDEMSTREAIMALNDVSIGSNIWVILAMPKLIDTSTDTTVTTTTTTTTELTTSSIPPTGEKPINPLIFIVLAIAVIALVAAFAMPAFKKKNASNNEPLAKDDNEKE